VGVARPGQFACDRADPPPDAIAPPVRAVPNPLPPRFFLLKKHFLPVSPPVLRPSAPHPHAPAAARPPGGSSKARALIPSRRGRDLTRVTNTARRRPYPIHPSTETHLSRGRRDRRSRPRRGGRQGMGRGASAWNFRGGGGLAALRVEPRARTDKDGFG